jgi:hypothetical protein
MILIKMKISCLQGPENHVGSYLDHFLIFFCVQELFSFLEDEEVAPRGGATADRLAVELTAGGLTPEHTRFVSLTAVVSHLEIPKL